MAKKGKKRTRIGTRAGNRAANELRRARFPSPEEQAAETMGRISGRSTLAQQEELESLGVPRDKSIKWTRYKAEQEIQRLKRREPWRWM